jgi:protein ImuB
MNAWLYMHAPQLLLDTQLALQTSVQQQQPQILLEGSRVGARQVVQYNQAAAAAGIHKHMTEVTATTLVAELQLRPYQAAQEQRILEQLAQLWYQDIAHIALYPPQGLLFEVASVLRLYGGFHGLLQQLQQRLQEWPIAYVVASGDTPMRARLLAQAGHSVLSNDARTVQQAVAQLPISRSGLEPIHITRLQQLGITTIGALQQRHRSALGKRFGRAMTQYLAQLQGELPTPQQYYQPPAQFSQQLDLLAEVASWQQLLFPLRRLLQQLEAFLQVRQLSVRSILLQVKHRDGQHTEQPIRFAHPVWQLKDMLGLTQLQLERQQLSQPALELGLRAQRLEPQQLQHGDLIQASSEVAAPTQPLGELVSRLQARLGQQAVQRPHSQRDWRPQQAQQWQLWQANTLPAMVMPQLPRPLWLLEPEQPIDPQQWQLQWGPERLASGWWDDAPCQRDYYVALDQQQRQGWIFHSQQGWFVHGWFT